MALLSAILTFCEPLQNRAENLQKKVGAADAPSNKAAANRYPT